MVDLSSRYVKLPDGNMVSYNILLTITNNY